MLDKATQQTMFKLSVDSIKYGFEHNKAMPLDPLDYPEELQQERAAFVTLSKQGDLRGCIGSLTASRPLAEELSGRAFDAAFRDPRFNPLEPFELEELVIDLSLLTQPEPLRFSSEDNLLQQVTSGVDGLILEWNGYSGTFLPSVWEMLPDKIDFLRQLKRKAGLATDFWHADIEIQRYTTDKYSTDVINTQI